MNTLIRIIPRVAAFVLALAAATAHSDASIISLASARVEGVTKNGISIYKGIPFAAPPVGNLSWRAPQSAGAWRDVYKATKFKPQCMQLGPPLPTMPVEPAGEDCLYLNVWAPAAAVVGGEAPRPEQWWW